jgi:hypothetical protein
MIRLVTVVGGIFGFRRLVRWYRRRRITDDEVWERVISEE